MQPEPNRGGGYASDPTQVGHGCCLRGVSSLRPWHCSVIRKAEPLPRGHQYCPGSNLGSWCQAGVSGWAAPASRGNALSAAPPAARARCGAPGTDVLGIPRGPWTGCPPALSLLRPKQTGKCRGLDSTARSDKGVPLTPASCTPSNELRSRCRAESSEAGGRRGGGGVGGGGGGMEIPRACLAVPTHGPQGCWGLAPRG